jgi:hypothetical protein
MGARLGWYTTCDPAREYCCTRKWRFGPSQKRQFPPVVTGETQTAIESISSPSLSCSFWIMIVISRAAQTLEGSI